METNILAVDIRRLGRFHTKPSSETAPLVEEWDIEYKQGQDYANLQRAAENLQCTTMPVAFPTETVYGLGADATRSPAVQAIFEAKGRPADNPLIVHVHSITQLQSLLRGKPSTSSPTEHQSDLIPEIYKPLIRKFWPGPLTIILSNPQHSLLAPEVTAGLDTFGARMPRSILALALIRLAGTPLAAPSANASTRPSPTAAEHVKDDLDGRIETIIDGGPCEVGVESTVVDGVTGAPTILRPGGITMEQLRLCAGWEDVKVGYADKHEQGTQPRAPGMKYRHYSPKATVILYEATAQMPEWSQIVVPGKEITSVGVIRTTKWPVALGMGEPEVAYSKPKTNGHLPAAELDLSSVTQNSASNLLRSVIQHEPPHATCHQSRTELTPPVSIWDIALGSQVEDVARGLFSALRELDKKQPDIILVEGIDDSDGNDIAVAVMNRLRKAAEIRV